VMLQFVIDTTGRVESNSIRILSSANPGFEAPARTAMSRYLFRPARVYGKAVRVLVQMPIDFKLTH